VTAGIVSAKGRNINIIQEKTSIESFIQTDAAVNRGNSGGALVNIDGELIGVITAIASPTGAYAGYSFAIPVNIARKVVDDLIKYGEVQRAYLGAYIRNLNSKMAEELHLNITQGVYIDSLVPEGSAEEAGLRKSDVIIKINGEDINNTSRLQEVIGRHRPGDKIKLIYMRGNIKETVEVLLKGKSGELETVKKERPEILKSLGIEIESLSASERKKLNLEGGVKVTKIYPGKISWETEMRDGFIITKVDKKKTYSAETFIKKIKEIKGGVLLEGVYPEKPEKVYYYAFGM
jgi:S1-C subfamily serine protease